MEKFVEMTFIFFIGSLSGWTLELFFRRFVSQKRWVNPGFLNGPYLPLYEFGLLGLYLVCRIDLSRFNLVSTWEVFIKMMFILVLMTLIEYFAGLIFIKGMKIKLWDYSSQWGNVQGIICPLFSLMWGVIGLIYYLFIDPRIVDGVIWLSKNLAFSFVIGVLCGIFLIDVCKSFNIASKIRKVAVKEHAIIAFEKFKVIVQEREKKLAKKVSFFVPFKSSESINDILTDYIKNGKTKFVDLITITEEEADKLSLVGFVCSCLGLNFVSLLICIGGSKSTKNKKLWISGIIISTIEIIVIVVLLFLYGFKLI